MNSAKLSVNVNKFALIRNARGDDARPNLIDTVLNCIQYGAQGITVHPRPDGRHIRRKDVYDIAQHLQRINVEFNIEGYPSEDFINMVCEVRPTQCTLVPDPPDALTSSEGWNTVSELYFLQGVIDRFHTYNIRTSLFVAADPVMVRASSQTYTDRVELYTGPYAHNFYSSPELALLPYIEAAKVAFDLGIGLNAGHDLSLNNLNIFCRSIPSLLEVSIGHALVCDALYLGLEKTIAMYLGELGRI